MKKTKSHLLWNTELMKLRCYKIKDFNNNEKLQNNFLPLSIDHWIVHLFLCLAGGRILMEKCRWGKHYGLKIFWHNTKNGAKGFDVNVEVETNGTPSLLETSNWVHERKMSFWDNNLIFYNPFWTQYQAQHEAFWIV